MHLIEHRPGRVIALGRVVLAVFFTLAVYLDPQRSIEADDRTFYLILAYSLFADAVLFATWRHWWLEAPIARIAHVVDFAVFIALVMLTDGYVSPFFTFFVFLVLSASTRWGWRAALMTTLLVVVLYLVVVATAAIPNPIPFEPTRFIARAGNLLVLSLMIAWFGFYRMDRGRPLRRHRLALAEGGRDAILTEAMGTVAERLHAKRVILVWSDGEEPWLNIWTFGEGTLNREQVPPGLDQTPVREDLAEQSLLFDISRGQMLAWDSKERRFTLLNEVPIDLEFATRHRIDLGFVIPVRIDGFEGHIIGTGVPGLSADDVEEADFLGNEISGALERAALLAATEDAAAARARLVVARDLHDSVAQVFAGMALRLRAIRNQLENEKMRSEIEELSEQLAQEQADLRQMIAQLRDPTGGRIGDTGAGALTSLADRLARQWGISCDVSLDGASQAVAAKMRHELESLLREAVANAVRHGAAKSVKFDLRRVADELSVIIRDDGRGFTFQGKLEDEDLTAAALGPRSLHERVQNLGGTLTVESSKEGAILSISLPVVRP